MTTPRRKRRLLVPLLSFLIAAIALGAAWVLFQMNQSASSVSRLELADVLAEAPDKSLPVNLLLMGYETTSNLGTGDPLRSDDLDAQRAATMIAVVRVDPTNESVSVLSIDPRTELTLGPTGADLGASPQIPASQIGPVAGVAGTISAVQNTLDIEIHHYLEMDVANLPELVDAVGGLAIYVPYSLRDASTGFSAIVEGSRCMDFDGESIRGYVQADDLEGQLDGGWQDLGSVAGQSAVERQRDVLTALLREIPTGLSQPIAGFRFWDAAGGALAIDSSLRRGDLLDWARDANAYQERKFFAFTLPVDAPPLGTGQAEASVPIIAGTPTRNMLAVFATERTDAIESASEQAREQAVRPGQTGLRSVTCTT